MIINLWDKLINSKSLIRGWHLARVDTHYDFAEDHYATDAFALDLKLRIQEIINKLATETYRPHPLFRIEVPKGSLGFRPGAVMHIEDRTVLYSIVLLLAESIDKKLPDSVYSWRLKKPFPQKGGIFKETTILDMPYLKKATISQRIDPFEVWYSAWPEFDDKARKTFGNDKFRYLATSDIAAYFENIQLPILRDQLLKPFPSDHKIINFMLHFFEDWSIKTGDGRSHLRGIPQGNAISSFLGNMFLLDLDREFTRLETSRDIKYQRYMDDVRVFAKNIKDARYSIFLMDRILRSLHLNVQTAKTIIYDEHVKGISNHLIDSRIDRINEIIEKYNIINNKEISNKDKQIIIKELDVIAKEDAPQGEKFIGTSNILTGLSARAFLRWITALSSISEHKFVSRLLKEIRNNPDYRFTKKLLKVCKQFPQKSSIESFIVKFINSDDIIYSHQKAECIRALRYLSAISTKAVDTAKKAIFDKQEDRYVRMESAYLLTRIGLDSHTINNCITLFETEKDSYVKTAIACLIVQKRTGHEKVLSKIVSDPNEKVSSLGKFFLAMENDSKESMDRMAHIFNEEQNWILCDNMPILYLFSMTNNIDIKLKFCEYLRKTRNKCKIVGLRGILDNFYNKACEDIKGSAVPPKIDSTAS